MKILVLFYLLIFNNLFAQKITVLEQGSNVAVPYATVTFYKDGNVVFGNYTNYQGEIDTDIEFDSVEISCLGFEKTKVSKNNIKNNTVFLTKQNIELEEVIINHKKIDLTHIGENKTKKSIINGVGLAKGNEIVQFIENYLGKVTKLNSLYFVTGKVKNKAAFRVHIYKKININTSIADEEIQTLNTIYYLEKDSDGRVEINLIQYDIDFPLEGLYIGLEGLGTVDANNQFVDTKGQSLKQNFTENVVSIQYQKSKIARTYVRHLIVNGSWFNKFGDKTECKKHGHGDLKVIYEPYIVVKVEK